MTIDDLRLRFPMIPESLAAEPAMLRFVETFGELLEHAREPSGCTSDHDFSHRVYMRLVCPIAVFGYGLSTEDKVFAHLEDTLAQFAEDPKGFARDLSGDADESAAS